MAEGTKVLPLCTNVREGTQKINLKCPTYMKVNLIKKKQSPLQDHSEYSK